MLTVENTKRWLSLFSEKITANKDYLNELDDDLGDGDHGDNLERGTQALKAKIESEGYEDLSSLFKEAGMTLVNEIGGASGPLYGSAFLEMAKAAEDSSEPAVLLSAGLEGIKKRGKGEPGEKTMVDIWSPAVDAAEDGSLSKDVIDKALDNIKEMEATKGDASHFKKRSIGHMDPGAQSSAYLFSALIEAGVSDE
ncbi:MAG: dihydroxyacetone kinase subunit DhaL [Alkalibacterium sp.]|nr:dihydroxyacetone kinase subunit DhaL [Alkalibacterium sp.]